MCRPIGLLDLPAEIRNRIYEYSALNEKTFRITKDRTRQQIASTSGLILTSRQVHSEYVSIVQEAALYPQCHIEASVADFDFHFQPLEDFISTTSASGCDWKGKRILIDVDIPISGYSLTEDGEVTHQSMLDQKYTRFIDAYPPRYTPDQLDRPKISPEVYKRHQSKPMGEKLRWIFSVIVEDMFSKSGQEDLPRPYGIVPLDDIGEAICLRLGKPSVSDDGRQWLKFEHFVSGIETRRLPVRRRWLKDGEYAEWFPEEQKHVAFVKRINPRWGLQCRRPHVLKLFARPPGWST